MNLCEGALPVQPIQVAELLQVMGIDHAGPFRMTPSGKKHILALVDDILYDDLSRGAFSSKHSELIIMIPEMSGFAVYFPQACSYVAKALQHAHDSMGHVGADATRTALIRHVYWPTTASDVVVDVNGCWSYAQLALEKLKVALPCAEP